MRLGSKEPSYRFGDFHGARSHFDAALGVGGFPRGRVVEVFDRSLRQNHHYIAGDRRGQKTGGMAAFIDAEHALDPAYARKLGVDVDNLLVSQPDNGEQALEIAETLITSGSIDVLVVDSVAALVPKAELDGEMGDSHMGLQARLMSQALRKLTGIVSKSQHLPDLHQPDPREDRRHVRQSGNHHRRPGSEVLLLVRIDIRRIAAIKDGDVVIGYRTRVKVVKNKVAAALPRSRVRYSLRRGDFSGRRPSRYRGAQRSCGEVGVLVQLQG